MMRLLRGIVMDSALKRWFLALLLLSNMVLTPVAHAAFDDMGIGARAPGMADAVVGIADDADAIYYNPAGLTQMSDGELRMEYGQHLRGLDDGSSIGSTYLGYAQPLKNGRLGTVGFAYQNFHVSNLTTERTLFLSYGWKLKMNPFGWKGVWSVGGSVKQLHRQYEPDRFTENALNDAGTATNEKDPLFAKDGYGSDAYAVDLGVHTVFGPQNRYSAGVMIMNANRPDVSLAHDGDKAPMITKVGLGYRPDWGLLSAEVRRAKRLQGSDDTDLAIGAERQYKLSAGEIALRAGYAEGSRQYKAITAGMSYEFARAELDYAFNFPVGNLAGTQGTHRVGFAFKMNAPDARVTQNQSEPEQLNLLASYRSDTTAARTIVNHAAWKKNISAMQLSSLLQLLIKRYPMDNGLLDVHQDLAQLMQKSKSELMDWPTLKAALLRDAPSDERINIESALDDFAKGDVRYMLARFALLSDNAKQSATLSIVKLVGLTELTAEAYRTGAIDTAIDEMKQMLDVLPGDDAIMRAYRQLLIKRAEMKSTEKVTTKASPAEQLPEAPQTLVAPVPLVQSEKEGLTELDAMVKNFGTMLGYYFTRKSAGATTDELRVLLTQIQTIFKDKGVDLTLVERELNALPATKTSVPEKPVTKPAAEIPAQTPLVVPTKEEKAPAPSTVKPTVVKEQKRETVKKSTSKPAPTMPVVKGVAIFKNMTLDRAWDYYREAVGRGISDRERIEILETILLKYGETGAEKVNQELKRLQRRVDE